MAHWAWPTVEPHAAQSPAGASSLAVPQSLGTVFCGAAFLFVPTTGHHCWRAAIAQLQKGQERRGLPLFGTATERLPLTILADILAMYLYSTDSGNVKLVHEKKLPVAAGDRGQVRDVGAAGVGTRECPNRRIPAGPRNLHLRRRPNWATYAEDIQPTVWRTPRTDAKADRGLKCELAARADVAIAPGQGVGAGTDGPPIGGASTFGVSVIRLSVGSSIGIRCSTGGWFRRTPVARTGRRLAPPRWSVAGGPAG